MRCLSAERDCVPLDAESSEHGAEWNTEIEQHRTLFDVQFDVSRGVFQFFPGIFYFFEIDSVFLHRVDQENAIFVFEFSRFVHVDLARARGRTEKTFSKARAFFIAPIDQPNRNRRFAFVLRTDPPKNLDAGKRI